MKRAFAFPVLVAALMGSAVPAAAEVPEPVVHLELGAQPVFYRPGDRLNLTVRVVNGGSVPVEGFKLQIQAYGRLTTRSALHASFGGSPGFLSSLQTKNYDARVIAAGETAVIRIADKIETLTSFSSAVEGVYPLAIQLFDSTSLQLLDEFTTHVLFYPGRPEEPLNLVLVVPIHDLPSRSPDGTFNSEPATQLSRLEESLAEDGWLTALLDGLERGIGRGLHIGVAPVPRLVDELADLADGYRRDGGTEEVPAGGPGARVADQALSRLRALLETDGIQPLIVPYSFVDMPTLERRSGAAAFDRLQQQMQAAIEVLSQDLEADLTLPWVYPPAGRLDNGSLQLLLRTLTGSAGTRTFFSPDVLVKGEAGILEGCPEAALSLTCPVSVGTLEGTSEGFVADAGLTERFVDLQRDEPGRLGLQHLLAETALIHAEQPGNAGRIVQATIPANWHPSRAMTLRLLRNLAEAPWLRTLSPKEGLSVSDAPADEEIVDEATALANEPDDLYFDELAEAESLVTHYSTINPPMGRLERLRRNLLVAWGRAWWSSGLTEAGLLYATGARAEVEGEFDKIEIGGRASVTMSSKKAPLPLVVFNSTTYPVRVTIELESTKLIVDDAELNPVLATGTNPLQLSAGARASGTFPLQITIETPDGHVIQTKQITIRSTEFNQIALGLTIGALAFMTLFYVVRVARRRRAVREGSSAS